MRQVTLNSNLPSFGKISDETWDLATHHFEILRHKFQDYRCDLYESNEGWAVIRVENSEGSVILTASFSTDRVTIVRHVVISPFKREIIHYADPRLTDDIISDLIREQETLFEKSYEGTLCRYRHGRMMWEEIWALAKHQLAILERRFQQRPYEMYLTIDGSPEVWLRVDFNNGHPRGKPSESTTLEVAFLPNHIEIATAFPYSNKVIDLADPKFTDDLISDEVRKLEMELEAWREP